MISLPLIKYILTAALRDRLMVTLVVMVGAGASLGVFLGSAAMTEQESFSTVFGAGGLRFLGVAGLVLFVCFHLRRAFDNKEVEFMLSRPISRLGYLFSHAAAFIFLALIVAVVVTLCVLATGKPNVPGLIAWGFSLMGEYAIMVVAALFFSFVLTSAAGSALATFGFYALARLIGTLIGISRAAPENMFFAFLNNVIELISVIIPRLDLMGQTSWLVYGVDGSAGIALRDHAGMHAVWLAENIGISGFIGVQTILCIALLLAASAFDFTRRQF